MNHNVAMRQAEMKAKLDRKAGRIVGSSEPASRVEELLAMAAQIPNELEKMSAHGSTLSPRMFGI